MTAIQSKWDGKAKKPVSNMQALAEYVAWMKELPSRAMYVDFHVDKNFNTTNTANAFTRTIMFFGGPLAGYNNISIDNEPNQTESECIPAFRAHKCLFLQRHTSDIFYCQCKNVYLIICRFSFRT